MEPGRADLKVKLLEVYFIWGNGPEFSETARRFQANLKASEEWAKVVVMGKQLCPNDALFQEGRASVA
jgi:hypothetical protein